MSYYLNFFARSQKGEYIPLGHYSRSSLLQEAMASDAPDEAITAMTDLKFEKIDEFLVLRAGEIEKTFARIEEEKHSIERLNNTVEEKLEALRDLREEKEYYNEKIEEINHVKSVMALYSNIRDDIYYFSYDNDGNPTMDKQKIIWCGYEICDPTDADIMEY